MGEGERSVNKCVRVTAVLFSPSTRLRLALEQVDVLNTVCGQSASHPHLFPASRAVSLQTSSLETCEKRKAFSPEIQTVHGPPRAPPLHPFRSFTLLCAGLRPLWLRELEVKMLGGWWQAISTGKKR